MGLSAKVSLLFLLLLCAQASAAPLLSNVTISDISKSAARIGFATSVPTTNPFIEWGTGGQYTQNQTVSSSGMNSRYQWFLSGLAPGTTYHFCPRARDAAGTLNSCPQDYTFITATELSPFPDQPELPRSYVDTAMPVQTGRTLTVPANDCNNAGTGLQSRLNEAVPGDTIIIPAGTVCDGQYKPKAKTGPGWIVIRTSTPDAQFPAPHARITPLQQPLMATIRNNRWLPLSSAPQNKYMYLPCKQGQYLWSVLTNWGFDLDFCSANGSSWTPVSYRNGTGAPTSEPCAPNEWYWDTTTDSSTHEGRDAGAWMCVTEKNGVSHFVNMVMSNSGGISEESALLFDSGAHHYRFIGIEFTHVPVASQLPQAIFSMLVSSNPTNHHIVYDRCYFHGHGYPDRLFYGMNLDGSNMAVVDSYLDNINRWTTSDSVDYESIGINFVDGPGPTKIVNNFISAIGISVFAPDDSAPGGTNPSDVELRGNYFYKDDKYRYGGPNSDGHYYYNRHPFELKRGRRWVVDSNIFDGNIAGINQGSAIALTPRPGWGVYLADNDVQVSDITITNNIVKRATSGILVGGHQSITGDVYTQPRILTRVRIANNLFVDINGSVVTVPSNFQNGQNGIIFAIYFGPEDIIISHNTVYKNSGNAPYFLHDQEDSPGANLQFQDNIVWSNFPGGGISVSGSMQGTSALDFYWKKGPNKGYFFDRNVMVGPQSNVPYPANNYWAADESVVKFTNPAAGDFSLQSTSPYKGLATDGTDPGVNMQILQASTASVKSGGAAPIATKPGDVNNDGAVNILDVQYVMSKVGTSDTNSDFVAPLGIVNIFDVMHVVRNLGM